ncbi:MAG: hypothetical protein R3C28_07055 [Pirellulaceae bacterium]
MFASSVSGQEIIRDNFDDGSVTDRQPVSWSGGSMELQADGLRIEGRSGEAAISSVNLSNSDGWSMRTEFTRTLGSITGVGVTGNYAWATH